MTKYKDIQAVLAGEVDLDDLLSHLDFSETDINLAAMQQPKLLLTAGRLQVRKTREKNRAEAALKLRRTELDGHYRKRAVQRGEKITEASLQARIDHHTDIRVLQTAFDTAREEAEFAKLLVEAYHARQSALKIMGNQANTEIIMGQRASQVTSSAQQSRRLLEEKRKAKYGGTR